MEFLTSKEVAQLQNILINNTQLQSSDADLRSALLINCGLRKYCGLVQLDKSLFQFVVSLFAKLSEVYITIDDSERLGLVVFLEYLSQIDSSLSTDEQHFIQYVITKWEHWRASKTRKQKSPNLENAASLQKKHTSRQQDQQDSKLDINALLEQALLIQVSPKYIKEVENHLENSLPVKRAKEELEQKRKAIQNQGIKREQELSLSQNPKVDSLATTIEIPIAPSRDFFRGKPVQRDVFIHICSYLNLEWKTIVDINYLLSLMVVPKVQKQRYEKIQYKCGTMQILYVSRPIELNDLFVEVNILDEPPCYTSLELSDLLQAHNPKTDEFDRFCLGKVRQNRVPGLESVKSYLKLMVLGKPGSGKSTFLQHIAIQCNQGQLQSDRIPIFIQLKSFAENAKDRGSFDLSHSIRQELYDCNLIEQSVIEEILKYGRLLILLDGLDEVSEEDSDEVIKQIRLFCDNFYKNQVIITCRIAAQQYRFPGFTDIEIADFNNKQIEEFAKKWFVAVDRNSEEVGKTKAVQFIEKLNYPENMTVREIATTPILLSLTCSVFQAKTEFPSNRVQLYEEGLEVLLSKWDRSKGIKRDEIYKDLYLQQKIELLTQIASITFEQNHYFFKQDEVQQTIGNYLRTLHNTQAHLATLKQDSEAVLKSVQVQHGLLVERARRIYSFSHLTFQEYFTARALIDSFNSGDLEQSVSHVTKKNWREVFLMAAGMVGSADNLLQTMKQRIDTILADDELQKFLDWVNRKSLLVQQFPYKVSAVRAFHFAIAHSTNLARNLRLACTLDPTFCHKRDFSLDNDSDLYCALITADNLIRDIPRNFISEKDFNLAFIRDRDIYRILDKFYYSLLPDTELAQSLHKLKNQLPEPYVDIDKFTSWWQNKGESWSEELRIIIVKYPNLGNYWQINEQHKKLLQQYYDANKLLLDCLNSGCEVTPDVRKEIEDTLLLPIPEIKTRCSILYNKALTEPLNYKN